jgi:hypothetical protein
VADTVSLVLNIDTRAGTTAVKGLSTEVAGLKTNADKAKPAMDAAAASTKNAADKATQAKGAVAALAAAMSMVSPEAARVVTGLANVAGAIGGVGKAATLLGASTGPLALLAVAVGAVAIAWKVVGDNAKAAAEKQKAAAATASAMQNSTNQIAAARAIDKFRSGGITRGQAISDLAAAGAQTPAAQAAAQQAAIAQATYEKVRDSATDATGDANTQAAFAAFQQAKKNAAQAVLDYATATVDAVTADLKKGSSGGGSGGGGKPKTGFNYNYDSTGITVDPTRDQILGGVTGTEINAGTPWMGDPTTPPPVTPPPPPGGRFPTGAFVGSYGAALSNLAGGNAGAALGMIPGPAGMITGMLGSIGTGGAAGVSKSLSGFKDAMVEALEALPEILTKVIPDFIEGFISEVIPALIADLPAILRAVIWEIPKAIIEGIAAAIKGIIPKASINTSSHNVGGWLSGLSSFDVGTARVTSDQLAMVHKDEAVLTPSQADAWRKGGGGGGSTEIHHHYEISGPIGDAGFDAIIQKRLSAMFGPGGVGYSTGLTGGLRSS